MTVENPYWVIGPSPSEVAADRALAFQEESADVQTLPTQDANTDTFDSVTEQLAQLTRDGVKSVAWKQCSAAKYKPKSATILDFRADCSLAAKRVLDAYAYTYFVKVWIDGEWPVCIVPPATLSRIRKQVGAAFRSRGLTHYFQNTAKAKL